MLGERSAQYCAVSQACFISRTSRDVQSPVRRCGMKQQTDKIFDWLSCSHSQNRRGAIPGRRSKMWLRGSIVFREERVLVLSTSNASDHHASSKKEL
jgi:hypothetical protein